MLSADYFRLRDEEIKHLESVLTIVGGKPVYAAEEFREFAPAPSPRCCRNGRPLRLMAATQAGRACTGPLTPSNIAPRCGNMGGGIGLSLLGFLARFQMRNYKTIQILMNRFL